MQSFWEWLEECASVWKVISEVFETSETSEASDSVGKEPVSKSSNFSTAIIAVYRLLGWNLPFYTAGFV